MAKLIATCFSYWCVMDNIKKNNPEYYHYIQIQKDCLFLEENARGDVARKLFVRAKLYAYNELDRLRKRAFAHGVIKDVGQFVNFCPVCDHALFWRRDSHGVEKVSG